LGLRVLAKWKMKMNLIANKMNFLGRSGGVFFTPPRFDKLKGPQAKVWRRSAKLLRS